MHEIAILMQLREVFLQRRKEHFYTSSKDIYKIQDIHSDIQDKIRMHNIFSIMKSSTTRVIFPGTY